MSGGRRLIFEGRHSEEKTIEDYKMHDEDSIIIDKVYNSIFYGQLTKNWLLVTK